MAKIYVLTKHKLQEFNDFFSHNHMDSSLAIQQELQG